MENKHAKDIIKAVETNETFANVMKDVPEDQKESVKMTLESFANLLAPMLEAVERVEESEEIKAAVRKRLSEKLRDS